MRMKSDGLEALEHDCQCERESGLCESCGPADRNNFIEVNSLGSLTVACGRATRYTSKSREPTRKAHRDVYFMPASTVRCLAVQFPHGAHSRMPNRLMLNRPHAHARAIVEHVNGGACWTESLFLSHPDGLPIQRRDYELSVCPAWTGAQSP